ncbi:unnamed protein product, partial [Brenthis ino]
MRTISYLIVLIAAVMASNSKPQYDLSNAATLFENFIKDYDRHYKDEADKQAHYEAFVESLRVINKANKEQSSATFDINNLADYTPEERKHLFGYMPITEVNSRRED